jgi:hypothetical protein
MRKVYLTRRRGRLFEKRRVCPICRVAGKGPRVGYAFQHPNPLRANLTVWRCRKHARLRFVPLDEKQGLGGGVYH